MDEHHQSQLLEQYLLALQTDLSAPIPADLDPELGRMAQRIHTYSQVNADMPVKKRVWSAVLSEFEPSIQKEEQKNMVISHPLQQKKSSKPLLWVAVLGIIFMLGSAIAIIGNNRPTPSQFGAGMDLSQDATPVIQATPTPFIENPIGGYVPVVTFYIPVSWGTVIREDMLAIVYWQADRVPSGSFRWIEDVVGKIATADIPRFMPVLDVFVVDETLAMTGIPNSNYMFGVSTATPMATPTATHTFTPTPRDQSSSNISPTATLDPLYGNATTIFENATGTAESLMIQPTPTATHTFTPTPRP